MITKKKHFGKNEVELLAAWTWAALPSFVDNVRPYLFHASKLAAVIIKKKKKKLASLTAFCSP